MGWIVVTKSGVVTSESGLRLSEVVKKFGDSVLGVLVWNDDGQPIFSISFTDEKAVVHLPERMEVNARPEKIFLAKRHYVTTTLDGQLKAQSEWNVTGIIGVLEIVFRDNDVRLIRR